MAQYKKYKKIESLVSNELEDLKKIDILLQSSDFECKRLGKELFLGTNLYKSLIQDNVYVRYKSLGKSHLSDGNKFEKIIKDNVPYSRNFISLFVNIIIQIDYLDIFNFFIKK